MLSGDPDAGKTFIALAIAAELSNGRVPASGDPCQPISTLYLSRENAPEYVIRPRFDALRGCADRFHLLRGSVEGEGEAAVRTGVTLKDLPLLESALEKTGARFIVIDPIQSYLGADVDAHRSNETRPVMDGLIDLAEKHKACVLVVRHLSKASGGRAIHRGLGSIRSHGRCSYGDDCRECCRRTKQARPGANQKQYRPACGFDRLRNSWSGDGGPSRMARQVSTYRR